MLLKEGGESEKSEEFNTFCAHKAMMREPEHCNSVAVEWCREEAASLKRKYLDAFTRNSEVQLQKLSTTGATATVATETGDKTLVVGHHVGVGHTEETTGSTDAREARVDNGKRKGIADTPDTQPSIGNNSTAAHTNHPSAQWLGPGET